MAPLVIIIQPIKSFPAPRSGNIVARSYQSGSMDHHTMIDVIVMIVIFVALLLSLSVLAWFRPTSLSSIRAIPILGTSVPVANTAMPMRSTATPGRGIGYSRQIVVSSLFHNWWTRASHNGILRIVTNAAHHEQTLVHVAQLPHTPSIVTGTEFSTRSPSFTTFASTSVSGAPSIVNTFVNSEAVELQVLGGSKTPSTPSLAVADNVDNQIVVLSATELIARVDVGTVPEAPDPS
ncbi:hypothetical protein F4604DRAFT_1920031 [Suillus subluteus]|nr:hypothetical protein F4604DRAFT_1920031 [Suillus subluteus]